MTMSEFGTFKFGWDAPSRITGGTVMLQEATEMLPGEVRHGMTPFLPTIVSGSDSSSDTQLSEDGHRIWSQTPAAVDLVFWQGDDIVIPFYFDDPAVLGDDMALNYTWYAQIRRWHNYRATLVADFVTKAAYHGSPLPMANDPEYTMVECFLPREDNCYAGTYRWELYSIATEDWSRFPKPDDVLPADWPPPDALRTWLWGRCYIVPRVSTTDLLPTPPTDPGTPVLTQGGYMFSGPNGRVP